MVKRILCVLTILLLFVGVCACAHHNSQVVGKKDSLPVEDDISKIIASTDFQEAGDEERREILDTLFQKLYKDGSLEAPAQYDEEHQLYTFTYLDNTLGGVSLQEMDELLDSNYSHYSAQEPYVMSYGNTPARALVLNGFENSEFRRTFYYELGAEWAQKGISVDVDTYVTVEDLAKLADYDVIMFSMHGGFYKGIPTMAINETITNETDARYAKHLKEDQTVAKVHLVDGRSRYWVLPSFFEKNYKPGSLNVNVCYVQCCRFYGCESSSSYVDEVFSDALLYAGASTVIGYRNSVDSRYGRDVMKMVLELMFDGVCAEQAVAMAKQEYGDNDDRKDVSRNKFYAYPHIDGDLYASITTVSLEKSLMDYVGEPVDVLAEEFGTNYSDEYYAGGMGRAYSDIDTIFFYNQATGDGVIYAIWTSGDVNCGYGLRGDMTYLEIVDTIGNRVNLCEPSAFYNEMEDEFQYSLDFELDGIHFSYSWTSEPRTSVPSMVNIGNMSLYEGIV